MRPLLFLVTIAASSSAILFGLFVFQTFAISPARTRTDAVVVLAGGRGRIEEGLRVYREQKARELLLVGVDPSVRPRDLFRERPGERVILENASRNTYENALYARDIIAREDIRSIRLITSRYHMKRAELIFRNVLPKDVAIYPHPVDSRNFKEEWWSHGGSSKLLFQEFYKYCVLRVFFLFAKEPGA